MFPKWTKNLPPINHSTIYGKAALLLCKCCGFLVPKRDRHCVFLKCTVSAGWYICFINGGNLNFWRLGARARTVVDAWLDFMVCLRDCRFSAHKSLRRCVHKYGTRQDWRPVPFCCCVLLQLLFVLQQETAGVCVFGQCSLTLGF